MEIAFTKTKETKGTFVYTEDTEPQKIGTLYLKKEAVAEEGLEDKIKVTVEKA